MPLFRLRTSLENIGNLFSSIVFFAVVMIFSGAHIATANVIDSGTTIDPLNAPIPTTMEGKATTTVTMSGNLSAGSTVTTFDIDDPIGTSSYSAGFQIFDSLGFAHGVTMYFTKTANNRWDYNVVGAASQFMVVSASTSTDGLSDLVATGTLGFTDGGLLNTEGTPTYYNGAIPKGMTFTNGAAPIPSTALTFNFGTSVMTNGGAGSDGMLQQGGASVILSLFQDGYSNGVLTQSTIDKASGQVIGHFSNGQVRILAQLSPTVFDIPNPQNDDEPTNSSTVQAEQRGVWTVGQLGTWHVKIDNDHNQPMAVRDMTRAQRSPWASTAKFKFDEGHNGTKIEPLAIPEGQRLIIEHISLSSNVDALLRNWDEQKVTGTIQVMLNDQPIRHHMGISETFLTHYQDGSKRLKQVISEPTRIYADPGSQIQLDIARSYFNREQTGSISLSGYLEPGP